MSIAFEDADVSVFFDVLFAAVLNCGTGKIWSAIVWVAAAAGIPLVALVA